MFNIYFKEMKKFFSLIALVGVFAACQPEQVQTAFSVAGATATINVQVYSINTGAAYTDVSVSSSVGTYANGAVLIEAPQSQGLAKQDVTLTVKGAKLAKDYTYVATVPNVLPGGHADVNAIIIVGENGEDFTFDVVRAVKDEKEEVKDMVNTHYATHSHADSDWYINNTEFLLEGEVEYDVLSGMELVSEDWKLGFDQKFAEAVKNITIKEKKKVETATLPITVSAYAMWRAWATYTTTVAEYTVKATRIGAKEELVAGTFTLNEFSSTEAEYKELAYPGAAGHYSHGHGHDAHGSQANAGGGIVYGE